MPHDMSLRVPVEQQQGRAAATNYTVDGGAGGLHLPLLKAFKHIVLPALIPPGHPCTVAKWRLQAGCRAPRASLDSHSLTRPPLL